MRLKDKVAVITGGSRGIGYATAEAFLREGATVVIGASSPASAEKAVAKLKEKFPDATVGGISPGLSRLEEVRAAFADVVKTYGRIDILVTSTSDATIAERANIRQLDNHTLWAVSKEDTHKARSLDVWMSHFKGSDSYSDLQKKYYRTFNPHKRARKNMLTSTVSPYDDLFRKYAAELDWDWRMLAAVVYQESRFSINSVSHRGAVGLMQIMPQTAGTYGVNDLVNPEKNLKAGTSHLKRLQKMLKKSGLEGDELVKFTLAAYNAGEGRIADCRRFAESINADSGKWSEITAIIPQMREDSILENKDVKLGKFQGYETIAYVDNIMSLYESICMIHPSR